MARKNRKGNYPQEAEATAAPSPAKKTTNKPAPVTYVREELNTLLPQYFLIRDAIDGEPAIKGFIGLTGNGSSIAAAYNGGGSVGNILASRARRYLPMPNESDQSHENQARYKAYVQRAVWYEVTARTLEGMVGQVFLIDPVYKMDKTLEDLITEDADGQGLSLIQLAKRCVEYTMAHGRSGILTDYPPTNGATTKAQLEAGEIRPVITVYPPWNIINWQTKKRGVKTILSLVVLRDNLDGSADDGFASQQTEQYTALKLVMNPATGKDEYTVEKHCFGSNDDPKEPEIFIPKNSTGKPFDTIPFTFIGSKNNDVAVDKPPMYGIASLNIAHYRNSADYEEMLFMVGQPTPYVIGITQEWYENVLHKQIRLGSRSGIPLQEGAQIGLLEMTAGGSAGLKEAIQQKEDQMVAIGAKLVIQRRVQKTATQTLTDASAEQSVLTNVADNVSAAIEFALRYAAMFVGASTTDIEYELNTSFELNQMTMDDLSKLVASWQQNAISFSEMRDGVRKAGIASQSDAEAKAEIKSDMADGLLPMATADPTSGANVNAKGGAAAHAKEPSTRNTQ